MSLFKKEEEQTGLRISDRVRSGILEGQVMASTEDGYIIEWDDIGMASIVGPDELGQIERIEDAGE